MSTLYTNLSHVNETPNIMRNDLNMISNIKIKLLRAGLFSLDKLSSIAVGSSYILKGVDVGIDRVIHLISTTDQTNSVNHFREIASIWTSYLINNYNQFRQYLTPDEDRFLVNRIHFNGMYPLFASLESYAPGEFVIRV